MRVLRGLVVLNLIAGGAHFGHNALYFDRYPLPDWITGPGFVVAAWFVLAALLVVGHRWFERGARIKALAPMAAYCAGSLLGLAHYLYGPPGELGVVANALIGFEAVAASALIGYVVIVMKGRRPATGALLCAVFVLPACTGESSTVEWAGTITDSAGVAVVANPAQGLWSESEGWTLVEELRIGEFGGALEYQFGQVGSIALNSLGEVIVVDRQVLPAAPVRRGHDLGCDTGRARCPVRGPPARRQGVRATAPPTPQPTTGAHPDLVATVGSAPSVPVRTIRSGCPAGSNPRGTHQCARESR